MAKAYDRELKDQFAREFKKISKEAELEKRRQGLAEERLDTVTKIEDAVRKEEDLEQVEKDQWTKELKELKRRNLLGIMSEISAIIYRHKGYISRYWDDNLKEYVDPTIDEDSIALAHSHGLVELDNAANTIALTEKGKYFLSQTF